MAQQSRGESSLIYQLFTLSFGGPRSFHIIGLGLFQSSNPHRSIYDLKNKILNYIPKQNYILILLLLFISQGGHKKPNSLEIGQYMTLKIKY